MGAEGEGSSSVGQLGDMAEPCRWGRRDTERISDVVAMRPGLHEASRQRGNWPHRRAVPPNAGGSWRRRQCLNHGGTHDREPREHLARFHRREVVAHRVDEVALAREFLGCLGREALWIGDRHGLSLVECGQVGDLVEHGPRRRRRQCRPLLWPQRLEHGEEGSGLVLEIVHQLALEVVRHRPCQFGVRRSAKAFGPSWASAEV